MGNLEKPLTWGLAIIFVGYLFIVNCKCEEENACVLNNGFNISNTELNKGFNISNTSLNGDVLKADAQETVKGWTVENNLPEGWSFKRGESVEMSGGFVEYLKEQGFTDMEIVLLQTTGDIYDNNGKRFVFGENATAPSGEYEKIKEDINPSPNLGNMPQNLLEKK